MEKLAVGKVAAVLEAKLARQELEKQINELQSQLDSSDTENARLFQSLKTLEATSTSNLEQMHKRNNATVEGMTKEHETVLLELEDDKKKVEDWAKRELCKLKQFHDEEKQLWHQRWQDDKVKATENETQVRESLQLRLQDEEQKHDEERQMLQDNIKQMQFEF